MILERRSEEDDITFRRLWGSELVKGGAKVLSGPQLGIAVPLVCVQLVSLLAGPTNPPLHAWLWDYRSNAFLRGQFPHTRPEELISNFPEVLPCPPGLMFHLDLVITVPLNSTLLPPLQTCVQILLPHLEKSWFLYWISDSQSIFTGSVFFTVSNRAVTSLSCFACKKWVVLPDSHSCSENLVIMRLVGKLWLCGIIAAWLLGLGSKCLGSSIQDFTTFLSWVNRPSKDKRKKEFLLSSKCLP